MLWALESIAKSLGVGGAVGHDSVQEGSGGDCFVRWTRSK